MKLSKGALCVILIALIIMLIGVVQVIARSAWAPDCENCRIEDKSQCPVYGTDKCPALDDGKTPANCPHAEAKPE